MNRILLNSGGGIHVEDGQIMLLPEGRTTESCACCGPPQPPPPECTRCLRFNPETGLYDFYEGYKKDFAVQISGTTDTFREYRKLEYDVEFYEANNPNTGEVGCGCGRYIITWEHEVNISGLGGLNGTYYGRDDHTNILSGTSTVGACNGNGEPFSLDDLVTNSSCSNPTCTYSCNQRVWMLDVPVSGTLTCSYSAQELCSNRPPSSGNINLSASLSGWARISAGGQYFYGSSTPVTHGIIAILKGTGLSDYGNGGDVGVQFNNGRTNFSPVSCGIALPGFDNWPGCQLGISTDISCYPFWRIIRSGEGHTCNESHPTVPPAVISTAACNDFKESETNTVDPICGPRRNYRSSTHQRTAFYSELQHIWTPA